MVRPISNRHLLLQWISEDKNNWWRKNPSPSQWPQAQALQEASNQGGIHTEGTGTRSESHWESKNSQFNLICPLPYGRAAFRHLQFHKKSKKSVLFGLRYDNSSSFWQSIRIQWKQMHQYGIYYIKRYTLNYRFQPLAFILRVWHPISVRYRHPISSTLFP